MTAETTKESQFFIVKTIRQAKDTCTQAVKDYNEKYIGDVVKKGKDFSEGVKKDARMLAERVVEKGKKLKPEIPGTKLVERAVEKGKSLMPDTKAVEKKITSGFNAVAEKVNLPSRKDIENLTAAMDALNTKVDTLNKKYSM
ncbi:hypothetical protein QUF80_01140 [Desulfococcaceae bacterium HSG8]|nr:hypothetical protein [Desulfococcaceae bacterium HSG8]